MNTALRYPGNALYPMQWRRFWRDGYVKVESLLNKEELSELRSAHDRLRTEARASGDFGNFIDLDAAEESDRVMNITQVCQRDIAFQRLLYHPHLLDIVEDLIGCNIQLFHDHLLHKPPEYGGPVFWHQDNQAWQSMPASNISCWLTFDDADADNGALRYLRGSHRLSLGLDTEADTGRLLEMDRLIAAGPIDTVDARAGDAIFHHCLTLHSSLPNRSKRPRRAHSIIYTAPGTRYGRIPPWGAATNGDLLPISFAHPLLRSAHAG